MNLREREHLIYLKKSNGLEGIYVYEEDLLVAKQIFIHRVMRSISVHEYFSYLSNGERSRISISNRLGKLAAAGILILMKQPLPNQSLHSFYYKVGKRGLELLSQFAMIDDSLNVENEYAYIRQSKIPNLHNTAISIIANKSYVACSANSRVDSFEHCRGSFHKEFMGDDAKLVPDWVFYNDTTIICMECDTGTQRQHVIRKKCEGYMEKAKQINKKGISLIVVFSVIDESIDRAFSHNRERRLASLKASAPSAVQWPDKPESDYGIHFYAVAGNRTPQVISRLLSNESPLTALDRTQYAEDWQENASSVLSNYYEMELVDKEAVLNPRRSNKLMDCDLIFSWRQISYNPNLNGKEHLVGVVYGDEGSVLTQQMIDANIKRMRQIDNMSSYSSASLLVCYGDAEQAEEDVFGLSLGDSSYRIADAESWESAFHEKKPAPKVLMVTSSFGKSWKEFDVK